MTTLKKNALVRHTRWGQGTVRFIDEDDAEVVNVRFVEGAKDVLVKDLTPLSGIESKIAGGEADNVLETVNRAQAEAIRSTNARWGIFARSKIDLLPHQLWVCHRVNQEWPARWLIADDVGLGKTIEAGLVASSLVSRGQVKRIFVLCPAPLVEQWRARLREMFGLRLLPYSRDLDTQDGSFWEDCDAVVASLDTIKLDSKDRKKRILEAPNWDLLLVDEAHRLGSGPRETTQAYRLVKTLMDGHKVASALFFTGTPHRGHDWGFYALLQLLRPEWFDPKRPVKEQLARLPDALIRNNKALVTDMDGKQLFHEPIVESAVYTFSPAETRFYERMTEFIASGQLYASGLGEREGTAVMLVLISMQKLASSSVAAIRSAIRSRLRGVRRFGDEVEALQTQLEQAQENEDDAQGDLEERLASARGKFNLVESEEAVLQQLLLDAEQVERETKIEKILELLESRFRGRSVLFFTEYKATQRLLLEALFHTYGDNSATFINGDNALADVTMSDGRLSQLNSDRVEAAEWFNQGKVKFLISTEAGGEGIDLQGACHSLIHVDLPWNPMRLHQRVGRLNRYGQTERVEVISLRNPDTVESLVWEHLNAKLGRISQSLNAAMDAPEDLLQLVLGMKSGLSWNRLHVGAATVKTERFADWFDQQTHTLGGKEALEAVQTLVGQASRFDFGTHNAHMPRVDLPDLKAFLDAALALNGHRLVQKEDGFAFKTPQSWKSDARWGTFLPADYEKVSFDRRSRNLDKEGRRLIGAGHNAFEAALNEAGQRESSFCFLPADIEGENLAVFRVYDRVTRTEEKGRTAVVGVYGEECQILEDWRVLQTLNEWSGRRALRQQETRQETASNMTSNLNNWLQKANQKLMDASSTFELGFQKSAWELLVLLACTKG